MTIQPESVPSLIFVVIYVVLSALIGIDGHAAKWKAPGSWLLTCVLFNFGFLGYWTTDQPWKGAFDVLAGTAVTLSGPAIVYVALSVNFDRLERKYVLIPLAFSIVTLVFAGVISTLKVTDPVFGLVQMPGLIALDGIAVAVLVRASRRHPSAIRRLLSRRLARVFGPTFLLAASSYYLAYFRFRVPGVHTWMGDMAIAAGMVATTWTWARLYEPVLGTPQRGREKSNPMVFISYSRADKEWVDALVQRLLSCNQQLNIFVDVIGIDPGAKVLGSIEDAIRRSQLFVPILTPEAVRSGWVTAEIALALYYASACTVPRVVPVILHECTIPSQLLSINYLDATADVGAAVTAGCLARLLAAPDVDCRVTAT